MALITIEKVSIIRGGKSILTDFSARIEPGKITAVIGPNGSGKSSLLGALAGDLPITSGMITIAGRDLKEISAVEQSQLRSVVLQNRNYWLSYTTRELIEMGQGPAELARVDAVMKSLDMTRYENQSVTTLSGGEAQRVEIARALIRDTPINLLDEPLSAQDVQSKARIIALLQELRDQGRTVLVIAHIDKSSLSWCDQIIDTLAQ
ncbi:ABC transporter ATP-binding protein [Candidatus Planktophila versatilis]|uniref:ABC transporter ATP-binding protein n=1 Tax=Candidatus Planktophila versatilis TaxID=1884905 RepID=UPI000BAC936B|nr:ABC transporter ATP-binding protein [Candidatus Planktophila versatilis]ASY26224.1 iron complex transport system ATP-binding protein [Candidatus Planktophila versatilis]